MVIDVLDERALGDSNKAFKNELESVPSVRSVTFSSAVPGRDQSTNVTNRREGFADDGQTMSMVSVNHDFSETYGLDLIAGRDFSSEFATDDSAAVVINEAPVKALTDPVDALKYE